MASSRCVLLTVALIALPSCGDDSSSPTQPAVETPGQVSMQVTYSQATATPNQVSPGPAIHRRMLSGSMTFTATGGPGVLGDNVSIDMDAPYFFGPVDVPVGTTRFDGQLVVDFDVSFSSNDLDASSLPGEADFSWEYFSDFERTRGTAVTQSAPIDDASLTQFSDAYCEDGNSAVACLHGGRWSVRIDFALVAGQSLMPATVVPGAMTNNTSAHTFDIGVPVDFRVRVRNTCGTNGAWTVEFMGTTSADRGRIQVWDRQTNLVNEYMFNGPISAGSFEDPDTASWSKSCQ